MSPAYLAPPEEEPTPEHVDFVADAIVAALSDIELFDDFADARKAARAAILADSEWRKGALQAEIDRLQAAKRRALALADERAKEANELRAQIAELKRGQP